MKNNDLLRSDKGFTLVEIVVAMVIFSILVTITTMGLISWTQYSENNKQDENAQLIFMAIKNKLAILRANNAVGEVPGWLENDAVDEDEGGTESGSGGNTGESEELGSLKNGNKYMICQKEDYGLYSEGEYSAMKGSGSKTLLDFVEPYVQDKKILNACIAVEYTEEGDIVTVFYSDKCDTFKYTTGSSTSACVKLGTVKKTGKFYADKRYELCVGMYKP